MAGLTDRIYPHLPLALQNLAITAYGYRWHRRRFSGIFEAELRAFRERENYGAAAWQSYQTTQLRRLLLHAFDTVPYYQRVYHAAGFRAADFHRFELADLKRLPFLEKDDLRKFGRTELVSRRPEPKGAFFASSGSTGTPTSILFSERFHQRWSAAFEARIRNWAGLDRHTPRGMIGGRRIIKSADAPPPYYRYNRIEKQTYFSAYHIARHTAPDYLAGMVKHHVRYMTGYAMSNYFLAAFFDEAGLDAPQLQAVITSSEKLTDSMRETFRKVYGCRTYDSYSGLEACGLISENEEGELAISPDVGIMEILDTEGHDVSPGDVGEVVSTGLLNFDQPLIRYRIGDSVRLSVSQQSRTGRAMPIVDEIAGRIEDKVIGPDGRQMVRFHGLFIDVPGLRCAQVVQEAIDRIVIRVVSEPDFSTASERLIEQRLKSQLGDVQVIIARMDVLPTNRNGKVQAVISHVKAN